MEKIYGKILEVFLPNNKMDSIGFKILIDNEVKEFIFDINEETVNILKDDKVMIIKQIIDNKEFIDIFKYEAEDE